MLKKVEQVDVTYTVHTVAIDTVVVDADLQMRVETPTDTIHEYVEAMKADAVFPPLECADVDGAWLLYDGFIRLAAYKRRHATEITVRVRVAESRDDVVLWAVQANSHQGLKRTNADKKHSVLVLLSTAKYGNMTNEQAGNEAGVSKEMVRKYRIVDEDKATVALSPTKTRAARVDKLGRARSRTYNKKDKKAKAETSRPSARQPTMSLYQVMARVRGRNIQWPTHEEAGSPTEGYVHPFPIEQKRKQENEIATREVIGRVRDIGDICKTLCATLPKITPETLVTTLATMEAQDLWVRKLNQYRSELEQAIPYINALLERTRGNQ